MAAPITKSVAHSSKYVIVGAGSAGCVLARRIAEFDKSATITLIEAGRQDRTRWDSWTIQMPSALTYNVADKRYNYDFHTVPQKNLNNRRIHEPRGKVLGGSSSINAMVYIRGHALDFERWAKNEGAGPNWDYASVLPYFKRAQRHMLGENQYRGGSGPLYVRSYDDKTTTNELFTIFRDAGVAAGYPKTEDVNGYCQEGFGPFDMTISPNGIRWSSSMAYLHPALADSEIKSRINVLTSHCVAKVEMDGKKAVGVVMDNGMTIRAESEVILASGAIGSPQLLMLSGIGSSTHLKELGIETIIDNPLVGNNLQDHLEVYLQYLCKLPVTLYPVGNWTARYLHRRVAVGLEWFIRGTGIAASNQFEMGGFVRTRAGVQHPDIQYHFIPGAVVGQMDFLPHHAFQVHVGTLRPTSRGTLRLASRDPKQEPLIDPNFLGTQRDMDDMRIATKLADEIVQQKPFDLYRGDRLRPELVNGPEDIMKDDKKLEAWIRDSSHSAYHPSCTCAIGKVVDENGKVLGAENLRVVDASIMPSMTSGNLNAPTIMIAEKIADNIVGRQPLAKITDAPFWFNPNWETTQR